MYIRARKNALKTINKQPQHNQCAQNSTLNQKIKQVITAVFPQWGVSVIYILLYSLPYSCNRWAQKGVPRGIQSMMD